MNAISESGKIAVAIIGARANFSGYGEGLDCVSHLSLALGLSGTLGRCSCPARLQLAAAFGQEVCGPLLGLRHQLRVLGQITFSHYRQISRREVMDLPSVANRDCAQHVSGSTLSSAMTPALSFVMTRASSWLGPVQCCAADSPALARLHDADTHLRTERE